MKIGTKSVLFGAHCFLLHPFFVAAAWWKLYGFPFDPRLWVAFFVHDLGYIGKPNMDGEEGELHPYFGAKIMRIFGKKWYNFTLYHSRFLAKRNGEHISKLCIADKMSFQLTPAWLYLPMVRSTGEIKEYMKLAEDGKYGNENRSTQSEKEWHKGLKAYMIAWIAEHKDGKADTWTKTERKAVNKSGVY